MMALSKCVIAMHCTSGDGPGRLRTKEMLVTPPGGRSRTPAIAGGCSMNVLRSDDTHGPVQSSQLGKLTELMV